MWTDAPRLSTRASYRYHMSMFINHIYRHAQENPDRVAVISDGQEISYANFACAIEAVRNHLMQAGLPDHGVIVRLDRNLYLDWVLLLAVRSFGLTTVSGPSWKAIERLGLKDITGVIGVSVEQRALESIRSVRPEISITTIPLSLLQRAGTVDLPTPVPDSRFGDHIVYTSGTTGAYKRLLVNGDAIDRSINYSDHGFEQYLSKGKILHCLAFETWSGPGYRYPTASWYKGATVLFDQRLEWREHFNDFPVAMTFAVPASLASLSKVVASRPDSFPSLKVQVGGGFVNSETVSSLIDNPNVELFVAYGGTEFGVGAINSVKSSDDLIWLAPTAKVGLQIVDDDDRPLPLGQEGNIRVRCMPTGPFGYLDDPDTTAAHFRNEHFYPGDLGVQREDGRVRILGRVQDVLNLGGSKIPVAPIEEFICQSLGVGNVCVFAVQDEHGRETLAVVIEARQFPTRTALEAAVAKAVRAPRLRVSKLDRFPRGENEMMKIDRRKVLELARKSWKS